MSAPYAATAARAHGELALGAYAAGEVAYYLFLTPHGPEALALDLGPEPPAALGPAFPVFAWDEREMADERGAVLRDPADARPFRLRDGLMPAALTVNGSGLTEIVVGPVHAGIIEPGRFTFSSGGETVVHLDAQLGYAHRGIERALEGVDALAAAPRIARICGSCSAARGYAYARALESLAGFRADPATERARLALCELERIANHLGDLAASGSAAGWMPGFTRGLTLKERALRLNARACGHRFLFDAIVPGGIGDGVLGDPNALRADLDALARDTAIFLETLFSNASVISRWQRAGIVTTTAARAFAAVGPPARAAAIATDVRTFAPYGAYPEFAVAVPHERAGDAFARCTVKRTELLESFRLVAAALAALSEEALPARAAFAVPAGVAHATVEGPRGAETVSVHAGDDGRITRFHLISASYRNWPLVARSMDGNIVPDFPLVNKSFNLCYACADR